MEGNERFVTGTMQHPDQGPQRRMSIRKAQDPFAAIVTCSDSRVVPELIFDQGLGSIFVVRVAGNVCDGHGLASVEYAVHKLHVPLVIVMGHTNCGAMTAIVAEERIDGKMSRLKNRLKRAVIKSRDMEGDTLDNAIMMNVQLEVDRLKSTNPHISREVYIGSTEIIGAMYDMSTGEVDTLTD